VPNFLEVGTKKKRDSAGLVPGFTMHGGPEISGPQFRKWLKKSKICFARFCDPKSGLAGLARVPRGLAASLLTGRTERARATSRSVARSARLQWLLRQGVSSGGAMTTNAHSLCYRRDLLYMCSSGT